MAWFTPPRDRATGTSGRRTLRPRNSRDTVRCRRCLQACKAAPQAGSRFRARQTFAERCPATTRLSRPGPRARRRSSAQPGHPIDVTCGVSPTKPRGTFRRRPRILREVLTPFTGPLPSRLTDTSTLVRYREHIAVAPLAQQDASGPRPPERSSRKEYAACAHAMAAPVFPSSRTSCRHRRVRRSRRTEKPRGADPVATERYEPHAPHRQSGQPPTGPTGTAYSRIKRFSCAEEVSTANVCL